MKRILACALYHTGAVAWKLRQISRDRYLILMYHRVIHSNEVTRSIQAGMYVNSKTFERHVRFLKEYFSVAPLSEVLSRHKKAYAHSGRKPTCILTFDDGWHDFYTVGFPILKAYQVPATVFLATDLIGTQNWFWTDRLAYLLDRADHFKKNHGVASTPENTLVKRLLGFKGTFESRLETAIELMKTWAIEEIEKTLTELSSVWSVSAPPPWTHLSLVG